MRIALCPVFLLLFEVKDYPKSVSGIEYDGRFLSVSQIPL
jgi:hypothetical protein